MIAATAASAVRPSIAPNLIALDTAQIVRQPTIAEIALALEGRPDLTRSVRVACQLIVEEGVLTTCHAASTLSPCLAPESAYDFLGELPDQCLTEFSAEERAAAELAKGYQFAPTATASLAPYRFATVEFVVAPVERPSVATRAAAPVIAASDLKYDTLGPPIDEDSVFPLAALDAKLKARTAADCWVQADRSLLCSRPALVWSSKPANARTTAAFAKSTRWLLARRQVAAQSLSGRSTAGARVHVSVIWAAPKL